MHFDPRRAAGGARLHGLLKDSLHLSNLSSRAREGPARVVCAWGKRGKPDPGPRRARFSLVGVRVEGSLHCVFLARPGRAQLLQLAEKLASSIESVIPSEGGPRASGAPRALFARGVSAGNPSRGISAWCLHGAIGEGHG